MSRLREDGYVLYTVIIMLAIVAATALLLSYDSAIKSGAPERAIEASNADYLADAALQHAIWQKDNYSCAGSVSIPPTSFGPHSYSANIGSTVSTTNDTLSPDRDSWIKEAAPSDNFGGESELSVKNKASDSFRALYHYDLSSISIGASVQSATAWFYVTSNDNQGSIDIYPVTAAWNENTVTWNNIASSYDTSVMGSIPAQVSSNTWVSVDVTGLAQQWVNDPAANHGFTLIATSDDLESKYTSIEYGGQKPYLEITTSAGAVSPVTISVTGTLASGASRTLTRTDVRAFKQPSTVVIQPDSATVDDALIFDKNKNSNFGADAHIGISSGTDNVGRSLLKFDLAAIPTGVRVLSAKLSLYQHGGSDTDVEVSAHRVFNPWVESEVSWRRRESGVDWNTEGGDFESQAAATTQVGTIGDARYEWDIAELVDGWLNRTYPNYGILLQTVNPDILGHRFDSSDNANSSNHPRLTIEYACECGDACMAPKGTGRVLMVIGDDPSSPAAGDAVLRDRFESWGYLVRYIQDTNAQGSFDTAVSMSDAVFISSSVDAIILSTKVKNAPVGVVTHQGTLNDAMGISAAASNPVGDRVTIVDTDHYITSVFPYGPVVINQEPMDGLTTQGNEAADAVRLAEWAGASALVVLDRGADLWNGGTAAGRRVMVPLGRHDIFNHDYWSNSGLLIVQRSLAWAMNADLVGRRLLMVVVNPNNLTAQESKKAILMESWGFDLTMIDQSAPDGEYDAELAKTDVVFVSEEVNPGEVGTKLTDSIVGVVLEENSLSDEIGFSDGISFNSGTDLQIDNSYYVTSPLASGQVQILSASEDIASLTGAIAPGIQTIGGSPGGSGLVALETGAASINGATAGRRIMLPWGGNDMDVDSLNANGLTIFERSIRWAADSAGTDTSPILISTDSDATLGGITFTDEDVMEYRPWDDTARMFIDGSLLGLTREIDALHVLANGNLVLSVKDNATLGGLSFSKDDLVEYNIATDTATLLFDGSALFAEPNEKITSVQVLGNGNYVLSTDNGATLGGLTFGGKDLVEYDPIADTATLYFDASLTTLDDNVAGVHVLPNGSIVFAVKGVTTLGGVNFGAADLAAYDPVKGIAELMFDGSEDFSDPNEKIMSLHIGAGSGEIVTACDGTFRDEFNAMTFSGDDGTLNWTSNWLEVGESDGPTLSDIQVRSDAGNLRLRTRDNDNGGEGVEREANLRGANSATLSYDYRRHRLDNVNDYTSVEIRTDPDSAWTEITRHQGGADDSSYQSASHDISAFISSATQIRFLTAPTMGGGDAVFFDNIQILCSP